MSRPRHVIERQLASTRAALANQAGRAGAAAVIPSIIAFQDRLLDELATLEAEEVASTERMLEFVLADEDDPRFRHLTDPDWVGP